jgi:anti-sigma factor RsiW
MTDHPHSDTPGEQAQTGGSAHLDDETLSSLIDGEHPAGDEQAARAHLASCEPCGARMRRLQSVARAVGAPVAPPPAGIHAEAVARALDSVAAVAPIDQDALPPIPIARTRSPHLAGIAAAIVAVVALTIGGVFLTNSGNSPTNSPSASPAFGSPPTAANPPEAGGAVAGVSASSLQLRPIISSASTGCTQPVVGRVPDPAHPTDVSNDAARPVAGAEQGCLDLAPALLTLSPSLAVAHEVPATPGGYASIDVDITLAQVAIFTRWENANPFNSIAAVAGDAVIGFVGAAGEGPTGKEAPQVDIVFIRPSVAGEEMAGLAAH